MSRSRIKRFARAQHLDCSPAHFVENPHFADPQPILRLVEAGSGSMAESIRKTGVKEVPLSEIKDDLSRYLREAETQEIVITRHGKPAGILIGFESEEDWFDYR